MIELYLLINCAMSEENINNCYFTIIIIRNNYLYI